MANFAYLISLTFCPVESIKWSRRYFERIDPKTKSLLLEYFKMK